MNNPLAILFTLIVLTLSSACNMVDEGLALEAELAYQFLENADQEWEQPALALSTCGDRPCSLEPADITEDRAREIVRAAFEAIKNSGIENSHRVDLVEVYFRPGLTWNGRGQYDRRENYIDIMYEMASSEGELFNTAVHEGLHAVFPETSHGQVWQDAMTEVMAYDPQVPGYWVYTEGGPLHSPYLKKWKKMRGL